MNRIISTADELLRNAEKLEITMHKLDGKICACFKIEGCIGNPFLDDDEEGETPTRPDFGLIRRLLADFERRGD